MTARACVRVRSRVLACACACARASAHENRLLLLSLTPYLSRLAYQCPLDRERREYVVVIQQCMHISTQVPSNEYGYSSIKLLSMPASSPSLSSLSNGFADSVCLRAAHALSFPSCAAPSSNKRMTLQVDSAAKLGRMPPALFIEDALRVWGKLYSGRTVTL
eukprot:6174614-Pleurochrysis_carterae.AAC.4